MKKKLLRRWSNLLARTELVDGKLVRDEDLAKPTPPESTPQEVPAKTVVKK